MGYRGHADWRDMSEYVIHFTKSTGGVSAYNAMTGILSAGRIEARSKFGCATNVNGLGATQHCACFSEIPLDMLDRLVDRRNSKYGIGFRQDTVITKGAGRVWYLDQGAPSRAALGHIVSQAMTGHVDPDDHIWTITPFVDHTAPNYHFEWEREWRAPGGLDFTPEEVAFLFVPEFQHPQAATFLQGGGNGAGPAYTCPILDPLWDDDTIQTALRALPPPPT